MKLEPNTIKKWSVATKTRSIKAKPMISIMVDKAVATKFLLTCIEGREPLKDGAVACLGLTNEIWQQMPKQLLKKYTVVGIDDDGWMECDPIPGNSVNCFEITQEFCDSFLNPDIHPNRQQDGTNYIIGQYGEQHDDGMRQWCNVGDWICQDRENSVDVWIVAKKIFNNTYDVFFN